MVKVEDAFEVTVGQFKKFLKSSGYKPTEPIDWNKVYEYSPTGNNPMIYVTWHDATAYCEWAGKLLHQLLRQFNSHSLSQKSHKTWIIPPLTKHKYHTMVI